MSTLSVDTINGQTTASKVMIPGHVVQVTALQNTDEGTSTSTSYAEAANNYRPAITPSSSSNKVLASFEMNIWADVDDDSQGTVSAQIKIDMYVNGSFSSNVYESNTNNLARGGQNRFTTINVSLLTTPSTTNEVTYRVSFRRSSGSRNVKFNTGSYSRAVLMEIAG